jgi:hypothetical protein
VHDKQVEAEIQAILQEIEELLPELQKERSTQPRPSVIGPKEHELLLLERRLIELRKRSQ